MTALYAILFLALIGGAFACNEAYKDEMEIKCQTIYDNVTDDANEITTEPDRTQALCCAVDSLEKCSLEAYDKASCQSKKDVVKENIKAAKLFLTILSDISCNDFRGQCDSGCSRITSQCFLLIASILLSFRC